MYSWSEQKRGGPPSTQAFDRLSKALMLTAVERQHLFLLAFGRPPEVRYHPPGGVTPRLRHLLESLDGCPAMIRNSTWDVIAWKRAAAAVITDYGALPSEERNVLRLMFLDPRERTSNCNWDSVARFIVGVFRGDAARVGAATAVQPLVDELCTKSPEFAAMWGESAIGDMCEGTRRIWHSQFGVIALEFSSFAVDGRADLAMLVHTPASNGDATRIRAVTAAHVGSRRRQVREA